MAVTEERVSDLEATMQKLAYEHMNTEIIMQNSAREHERLRAEMNKKWGELANKMGTIVEDIVLPNIPTIASEYFNQSTLSFSAARVIKEHPQKPGITKEFDIIAIGGEYLFLNETKSTPRQNYLEKFSEEKYLVFEYFPEYKEKTLIPIFSSLNIPKDAVNYLSKHGIYAMAMKGDTMVLLNFEEVSQKNKDKE